MIKSIVNQRGPMGPGGGGGQSSVLLWVIIMLLIIIIVYLWYNNRKTEPSIKAPVTKDMDKIDVVLKLLNSSEKIVIEALIDKGGEMLQKDIHYELDLSRVQAHRTVQSLTQRELVTVEDHFNTKKIVLADWLIS